MALRPFFGLGSPLIIKYIATDKVNRSENYGAPVVIIPQIPDLDAENRNGEFGA